MIFGYKCLECGQEIGYSLPINKLKDGKCPECGGECETSFIEKDAPRFHLDPICGDFKGATDKWAKGRERKMAKERHNLKEHGTYK